MTRKTCHQIDLTNAISQNSNIRLKVGLLIGLFYSSSK